MFRRETMRCRDECHWAVLTERAECTHLYNTYSRQANTKLWLTFVQCRTNFEDVGPTLYKCYTNVLCVLDGLPSPPNIYIYRNTRYSANVGLIVNTIKVTLVPSSSSRPTYEIIIDIWQSIISGGPLLWITFMWSSQLTFLSTNLNYLLAQLYPGLSMFLERRYFHAINKLV